MVAPAVVPTAPAMVPVEIPAAPILMAPFLAPPVASVGVRAKLLKPDLMKDATAFLDLLEQIHFYLRMPEFFTGHADGSLTTNAGNLEPVVHGRDSCASPSRMGVSDFSSKTRVVFFTYTALKCWTLSCSIVVLTQSPTHLLFFSLYSTASSAILSPSLSIVSTLMALLLNRPIARW
jgi:hypothetical protein